MPIVLTVSALAVLASFILEAAAGAPTYAYLISAVGAVLILTALFLYSRAT
ncbi:hypothetical protein [Jatrophihabitans sp.]|uniref:hypothetical protein n=1 Tax=Jatrophihabitans sp. TaxID=1932789 RepID=UPI002B6EB472|nr:hypothetical protein [Jatrophihabitans sp.]